MMDSDRQKVNRNATLIHALFAPVNTFEKKNSKGTPQDS